MLKLIEPIAKYGALAAAGVEWTSWILFYAIRPHEFGPNHPISYFATLGDTRWIFTISYLAAPLLFWLYIKFHLKQALPIFTASMIGFALVAIIPYDPQVAVSNLSHIGAFLFTAVTFMIGMYQVAVAAHDRLLRYGLLAFTGMSLVAYVGLLLSAGSGSAVLYWELGWWVTCQLWMIWVSVYDLRIRPKAAS